MAIPPRRSRLDHREVARERSHAALCHPPRFFSEDIRLYLDDDAIEARPPTTGCRVR